MYTLAVGGGLPSAPLPTGGMLQLKHVPTSLVNVYSRPPGVSPFQGEIVWRSPWSRTADIGIHVPRQPFVCGAQHLKCVPFEGISELLVWFRGWTDLSSVLKCRVGELDSCTGHVLCSACVTLGRH